MSVASSHNPADSAACLLVARAETHILYANYSGKTYFNLLHMQKNYRLFVFNLNDSE